MLGTANSSKNSGFFFNTFSRHVPHLFVIGICSLSRPLLRTLFYTINITILQNKSVGEQNFA
jgi:hypothetical protein